MKRLLLIGALILFESLVCSAQGPVIDLGPNQTLHFFGVPSGSCRSNQYAENNVNGDFYNCLNNAWNKVSGAGGGGTVTGVLGTANQIASDGSSTTPTLSLSSTLIFPGTATLASATTAVANSPLFTIAGAYQNAGTPTFAADTWTIQDVIAAGTNGQAKLAFVHSGSTAGTDEVNFFGDAVRIRNGILVMSGSGNINWTGRAALTSPADGVLLVQNAALTDVSGIKFGGTTASFPYLKKNSTALNVRLADDSADAPLTASTLGLSGAATLPSTSGAAIGNFSLQFGTTMGIGNATIQTFGVGLALNPLANVVSFGTGGTSVSINGGVITIGSGSGAVNISQASSKVMNLGSAGTNDATGSLNLTNLTASGAITESLGAKFTTTHGANAAAGVSTLSGGTVTVSTTAIAALATAGGAGDVVILSSQTCTSCGHLSVGTVTAGTSFVINSTNASDASNVYWEIKHVN